jgi:murein DD-endopeptidase MepM/ murein hydrolase activator NlpD
MTGSALCLLLALSPAAAQSPASVPGAPAQDVTILGRGAAPGEALLVAVNRRDLVAPPAGTFRGEPLEFYPVSGGGWAALVGLDLDVPLGPAPLALTLTAAAGPRAVTQTVTVRAKAYPTRHLTVDDRYVRLSPADQARVEAEQARTRAIYAGRGAPRFAGAFVSPIPGAPAARFGERRVFNGVPKDPHSGADLRAAEGDPVHAPAAGRVVLAGGLFYSGNTVILDHGLGLFTIYAHLSRIDVAEGQDVTSGALLGLVGHTGRVTGPHLHWGVKLGGARVDPFALTGLPLAQYRP